MTVYEQENRCNRGSGAAASYVTEELLEHGYEVKNIDITAPQKDLCPFEQIQF